MLGIKLEDQQALDGAAETPSVPGLAFPQHGPRALGRNADEVDATPCASICVFRRISANHQRPESHLALLQPLTSSEAS